MKSSNLAIQPQTDVYILLEVIPDIEQRYSFVHFTSVSKYREQTDGISICGTGELLTVKKPSLVALEDISKIADTPERYTTSIEKMPTIDCENRKPFQGKISLQAHDAVEIEGEVYGEQKWQVYVAMKDNYLVYPIAINQRHFCFRACKKDVQEIQEFGLQQVEDNDELEHGIQKEWFSTNTVKRFQRGMESLIGDNPVGCHEAFREEKLDEAASQEEALYLLEMLDETGFLWDKINEGISGHLGERFLVRPRQSYEEMRRRKFSHNDVITDLTTHPAWRERLGIGSRCILGERICSNTNDDLDLGCLVSKGRYQAWMKKLERLDRQRKHAFSHLRVVDDASIGRR